MITKTQELVTAGYALAKGLDAESAKLVKELATELAVQRVRADELNKQVVSLAVEHSSMLRLLTDISDNHGEFVNEADDYMYASVPLDYVSEINMYVSRDVNAENPFAATDTAIEKIKLLGVDAFAAWCDEKVEFMSTQNIHDDIHLSASQSAKRYTNQLRKEAGNAN